MHKQFRQIRTAFKKEKGLSFLLILCHILLRTNVVSSSLSITKKSKNIYRQTLTIKG
jgi:hypothetical protein